MKLEDYRLIVGDCVEAMRSLPDQSVNCCVTSPPYFGLRDYGVDGQIGLEETPEQYVARLVEVFREVKRVLSDDGTLWLNLGDSYAQKKGHGHWETRGGKGDESGQKVAGRWRNMGAEDIGLKPKDLIGMPWRVAFALQADGWYLRQDIIWNKPNAMPESVRDRCTKSHEYLFLLSKSARYYFDGEAIKEPAKRVGDIPGGKGHYIQHSAGGHNKDGLAACEQKPVAELRNRRSVWNVATKPYKGAHFATFPQDLIEPCILAGCPDGGVVLDPFGGSGTTAGVAIANGRKAVLCELNPEYAKLVPNRIASIAGSRVEKTKCADTPVDDRQLEIVL